MPGSGIVVAEVSDHKFRDLSPITRSLCDRSALLALDATRSALANARLDAFQCDPTRVAVVLGNASGGQCSMEAQYVKRYLKGEARPSPLTVAKAMVSSPVSWVSIVHKFQGPCFVVSSACASATHAIGIAAQLIKHGVVDVAITGGVEACLTDGVISSWASMGVLAPETCQPFSLGRKGIILAEAAAVLVLEAEEHAISRKQESNIRVAGFGSTADAADIVAPSADGMANAMRHALLDADIISQDIDYINAHGTGTVANDRTEIRAIKNVFPFPDRLAISSTKAVTGHALGAAGGLGAIATVLALQRKVAPPTANYTAPDPECDLDVIPNSPRSLQIRAALSNSFAFGGLNASLVFVDGG